MKKVGELQEEENTSSVCRDAYEQTLERYHTFLVKKGAKLAMYAMPTRGQLLKKVIKKKLVATYRFTDKELLAAIT